LDNKTTTMTKQKQEQFIFLKREIEFTEHMIDRTTNVILKGLQTDSKLKTNPVLFYALRKYQNSLANLTVISNTSSLTSSN